MVSTIIRNYNLLGNIGSASFYSGVPITLRIPGICANAPYQKYRYEDREKTILIRKSLE